MRGDGKLAESGGEDGTCPVIFIYMFDSSFTPLQLCNQSITPLFLPNKMYIHPDSAVNHKMPAAAAPAVPSIFPVVASALTKSVPFSKIPVLNALQFSHFCSLVDPT